MVETVASAGLVVVGLSVVGLLYRIVRGPSAGDRIAGIDSLAVNVVAFVVLFGIAFGGTGFETRVYLDLALVAATISFLATAALGRFLVRRHEAERKGG